MNMIDNFKVTNKIEMNLFDDNIYHGKFVGHIGYEYIEPGKKYIFITDNKGEPPFAIRTADAPSNELPAGMLSKIPMKHNYYIVKLEMIDGEINVDICSWNEPIKGDSGSLSNVCVNVKAYDLQSIPDVILKQMDRAVTKLNTPMVTNWEYTIDKFAYNPLRAIESHLFMKEDKTLISTDNTGASIELTNKCPDKWRKNDKIYSGGLYRIYYYTKYQKNRKKYVRGVRLQHLTLDDVLDYKETIFDSLSEGNIKLITLLSGFQFVAVTLGEKINALYKMNGKYRSITLNEEEKSFIMSVKNIVD